MLLRITYSIAFYFIFIALNSCAGIKTIQCTTQKFAEPVNAKKQLEIKLKLIEFNVEALNSQIKLLVENNIDTLTFNLIKKLPSALDEFRHFSQQEGRQSYEKYMSMPCSYEIRSDFFSLLNNLSISNNKIENFTFALQNYKLQPSDFLPKELEELKRQLTISDCDHLAVDDFPSARMFAYSSTEPFDIKLNRILNNYGFTTTTIVKEGQAVIITNCLDLKVENYKHTGLLALKFIRQEDQLVPKKYFVSSIVKSYWDTSRKLYEPDNTNVNRKAEITFDRILNELQKL